MTNAAATALQEHPAFAGLSQDVLNAIQQDASLLDFQPGQPLSAGDQNASDRNHRQRNTPEHPFPLSSPSDAAAAEHPQVGWPTLSAMAAAL